MLSKLTGFLASRVQARTTSNSRARSRSPPARARSRTRSRSPSDSRSSRVSRDQKLADSWSVPIEWVPSLSALCSSVRLLSGGGRVNQTSPLARVGSNAVELLWNVAFPVISLVRIRSVLGDELSQTIDVLDWSLDLQKRQLRIVAQPLAIRTKPRTYAEEKLESSLQQELLVAEHTVLRHLGQKENPVLAQHLSHVLVHASVLAQKFSSLPASSPCGLQLDSRVIESGSQHGVVLKPVTSLAIDSLEYLLNTCYPDDVIARFSDGSLFLVAE